jgi:hypothetical protein
VKEVTGGLRIEVTNRVLIPVRKDYGCRLYLRAARVRVDLPRALEDDRVLGACRPGEETPEQRICTLMEQAGGP